MGNTNWSAQQQQQQQQQLQQQQGMSGNSNTLSYGSLKNRFLSGASKNNAPVGSSNAVPSGGQSSGSGAAKPTSSGSKLFSLAR
jgi:hypothetical protein